jgi:hypothetical protein
MSRIRFRSIVALTLGVMAVAGFGGATRAEFQEEVSIGSDTLVLSNLIGEITAEGYGGTGFEIEIRVQGADATRERVRLETTGSEVAVVFPLEESTRYIYPRMKGSKSNFSLPDEMDQGGWLSRLFGGKQIKVRSQGSGLEIWADVVVRVPRDGRLAVHHGLGNLTVKGVDGSVSLSAQTGGAAVTDLRGDLVIDTGSGGVAVEDVVGDVEIDTGSGSVALTGIEGSSVEVDTGSGSVRASTVACDDLSIDTGSGSVKLASVTAESASVDTGSGSVEASFDRLGEGNVDIDTGSGSITLTLPPDASATIDADTGSGGIRVGFADARVVDQDDGEMTLIVGGGTATINLDTGSGGIRIN